MRIFTILPVVKDEGDVVTLLTVLAVGVVNVVGVLVLSVTCTHAFTLQQLLLLSENNSNQNVNRQLAHTAWSTCFTSAILNDASTMLIKVPVVADVGEVVTVVTVLAVGEVTVVGVVVLSLVHTYGHRVQHFRQIMVHF